MKLIIACLFLSSCLLSCFSKSIPGKGFIHQGLIRNLANIYEPDGTANPYGILDQRIWFYDSTFIFEIKILNTYSTNNILTDYSLDPYKYSYFDLRTRKVQEYYNFRDTAKPFAHYSIDSIPLQSMDFFTITKDSLPGDFNSPSDTTIDGRNLSRIKTYYLHNAVRFNVTNYLDCTSADHPVHLNPFVDSIKKGCKVIITETTDNGPLVHKTEIRLLNDRLTKAEQLIFTAWKTNAKNITLPLLGKNDKIKTFPVSNIALTDSSLSKD